ncbi:ABC transporter permease [Nocardioides ochotonae]|uniref:ABC transporter permease n=1 Tax=Nocardioides ochotonae TaxID=2685869 RepID=UPI00140C4967|nr:multidrug ABC transporter permease [Nocardioides ochotonae]
MSTALTGTRPLLKVSLRQDARHIAPWVAGISALSASSILAYAWIFPDASDREQLARTLGVNPALALIFGPARDLTTADGFNSWRAGMLGAFFAALMAILIVVRNSRAQEDSGQAELVASGVLARGTRLAVAVLMASTASVALGVVCFAVTLACGGGASATLILSATFTASGLMFTGVAAIAAQLGSDAHAASSIAIGTLGVCYVARGYVDSSDPDSDATWLTPLGWLSQTRPGTEDNPWPLLLALVLAIALVAIAFVLQQHRDFAQGMLSQRPGPARAGLAGSVWGLALRLNVGALATWLIAFVALGFVFGNLATSVGDVAADSPALADIVASGGGAGVDLTSAFITTILQIIAIVAAITGVQVAQRIYGEEVAHRVEPLLAGSLRRTTFLASHVTIALVGSAIAMLVAGTTLALVASTRDDTVAFRDVVAQAAVTVPGVWALVALALAFVGAAPTRRLVGWLGVVATFGLTLLGPTFKLPDWALDISPLRHVPDVTADSPDWAGLTGLGVVVGALLAVGFAGFRRRDVA